MSFLEIWHKWNKMENETFSKNSAIKALQKSNQMAWESRVNFRSTLFQNFHLMIPLSCIYSTAFSKSPTVKEPSATHFVVFTNHEGMWSPLIPIELSSCDSETD